MKSNALKYYETKILIHEGYNEEPISLQRDSVLTCFFFYINTISKWKSTDSLIGGMNFRMKWLTIPLFCMPLSISSEMISRRGLDSFGLKILTTTLTRFLCQLGYLGQSSFHFFPPQAHLNWLGGHVPQYNHITKVEGIFKQNKQTVAHFFRFMHLLWKKNTNLRSSNTGLCLVNIFCFAPKAAIWKRPHLNIRSPCNCFPWSFSFPQTGVGVS